VPERPSASASIMAGHDCDGVASEQVPANSGVGSVGWFDSPIARVLQRKERLPPQTEEGAAGQP